MTDTHILQKFRPQVAAWFADVFAAPTAVQAAAWESISAGENALVIAPTGSGKTLAEFLWALNSLVEAEGQTVLPAATPAEMTAAEKGRGVKVLYISPLKALGVDVEHNLRAPLQGIARAAQRMGLPEPNVTIGVRSGDTPSAERARQLRRPPDIMITTPESAYLMLTSKAAGILRDVDTVIIDEIHALAGTKRGVHMALTLERLARVAGEFQRIGLSATVRPPRTVAQFLGGDRPVQIIDPPAEKKWTLDVHGVVPDMADLPTPEPGSTIGEMTIDDPSGLSALGPLEPLDPEVTEAAEAADIEPYAPAQKSIWPFIEQDVYKQVMGARSTLIFVNSRRTAERLTSRINELYASEHDPEALARPSRRDPAQLMKQVDTVGHAPAIIARAHHGSVSKDERALTETMLKEGTLKAVVATSSLELGIDMGAVDLVINVESPPSIASGLQRVGRAGHGVGEVSRGAFYPKHRADLVQTTVTVEQMRAGEIEAISVPRNPLDVLVQQTVAAVAMEDLYVDDWFDTVRRAFPYRELARDVFDAVIDLASGVYPSTDFAELKPRVNFDRVTGVLSARPGAQRVAVTSGGTIPDRGMFGVFLVGAESGSVPRRVGELDEEMVYESRVGDVFTLGASSWRIEDITRDQVLVTPAPGHTGRLPFWNGDQAGRPAELGAAIGAFRRHVSAAEPDVVATRLRAAGLDQWAADNVVAFLDEQRSATGVVPDEKTLVLERFKDEVGDWRVVLHSPYGRGVNAAWALAVGARVAEETGMDPQAVAGDDGIVIRLPEGEAEPGAHLFTFEENEIADVVTEHVGGSALFASRFRECAARALLLPRRNPGKRAPLWQQRQRAAQLLDVARNYPSFPIILETVRECLQDVYDVPALTELMAALGNHTVRVAEVTTEQPSPFASTLLFNYTGAFMYEGDTPLAEKRAAALALDPALLAKLLGEVELRELLEPEIVRETHEQLQRTAEGRQARTVEELIDVLRIIGPIPVAELTAHTTWPTPAADALREAGDRVMEVRIAGVEHLAVQLDAPLLRDGLGVPVPPGVPAQVAPITDAADQLVGRWARTRGPFVLTDLVDAFGLAPSVAARLLDRDDIIEGHYRQGVDEQEYCNKDVLGVIRRRSLARARSQMQPVSHSALARFQAQWNNVAPVGTDPELAGVDGTFMAIEQLAGVRLPASAWESVVLPQRVFGYQPAYLDELTSSGEVLIVGAGAAGAGDPWLMLLPADYAPQLMGQAETSLSILEERVMELLSGGGGFLFSDLKAALTVETDDDLRTALWALCEKGLVAPDSFARVRDHLVSGHGTRAHRARRTPARGRLRMGRTSFAQSQRAGAHTPSDVLGRWSALPAAATDATQRGIAHGEAWLDRYGVVTRGSVVSEDVVGGFALAYKVLSSFEDNGQAMRGYFVEGLGAAQFSTRAVVDRLRGLDDSPDVGGWPSGTDDPAVYVLAAADPANPYGAALPWPETGPTRGAGALVVLIDGLLLAHLTRGGKTLRIFDHTLPKSDVDAPRIIVEALQNVISKNWLKPVNIEKINGEPALSSPCLESFRAAGAKMIPRGIKVLTSSQNASPRSGRSLSQALAETEFTQVDGGKSATPFKARGRGQRGRR